MFFEKKIIAIYGGARETISKKSEKWLHICLNCTFLAFSTHYAEADRDYANPLRIFPIKKLAITVVEVRTTAAWSYRTIIRASDICGALNVIVRVSLIKFTRSNCSQFYTSSIELGT